MLAEAYRAFSRISSQSLPVSLRAIPLDKDDTDSQLDSLIVLQTVFRALNFWKFLARITRTSRHHQRPSSIFESLLRA